MWSLFKSFLFKLKKDVTFRIVCVIGLVSSFGLALFLLLLDILFSIGTEPFVLAHNALTGENMFFNSAQPILNFAIALPIVLITFIGLEFSQGCIRNKVISGHSKAKIYVALFFFGLLLTCLIMTAYVGLSTGLGCLLTLSGFHFHKEVIIAVGLASGKTNLEFFIKFIVLAYLGYATIVSITTFFSTLVRNVGLTIVIVIMALIGLYIFGLIVRFAYSIGQTLTTEYQCAEELVTEGEETFTQYNCEMVKVRDNPVLPLYYIGLAINPFFCITQTVSIASLVGNSDYLQIPTVEFIINVATNIVYTLGFFFGGLFIFRKSDIK